VEALLALQAGHPRLERQHQEQDGGHRRHRFLVVVLRLQDHLTAQKKVSVPDPKLLSANPDPQNENKEFKIRILL